MKIERLGAWYALDKLSGLQIPPFLTLLERLNYDVLWYPESRGYESLSLASFLLGNSTKLKIGSSIASIYARDAFTARRGMLSLNSLYCGRFILGLGVSHAPVVEGVRGHIYAKPVAAMRGYLDCITKDQSGSEEWPIAIAALGPLMLKLAGERTRGALPYNVTPEHTARAAKLLGQVVGSRAKSLLGDGCWASARARPQGTRALHGPRQLSQLLAQPRLHGGGSGQWRLRSLH